MFKAKTVDRAIRHITSAVKELRDVQEFNLAAAARLESEAQDLVSQAADATIEADRASTIADRFSDLVGE